MQDPKPIIEAARASVVAEDRIVDVDTDQGPLSLALVPDQTGRMVVTSLAPAMRDGLALLDSRAPQPRARRGTATFTEEASFVAHVLRFADPHSVIYADRDQMTFTAIYDYHEAHGRLPVSAGLDLHTVGGETAFAASTSSEPGASAPSESEPSVLLAGRPMHEIALEGAPRWGRHRALFRCKKAKEWMRWRGLAGTAHTQEGFRQFVEEHRLDLALPDAGKFPEEKSFADALRLLDVATTLTINEGASFKRTLNPTTSETVIAFQSQHGNGSTVIPPGFVLEVPVFEGGDKWRVRCLMRFSFNNGQPRFAFVMHRADDIEREAFSEVFARIEHATDLPVWVGGDERADRSSDE